MVLDHLKIVSLVLFIYIMKSGYTFYVSIYTSGRVLLIDKTSIFAISVDAHNYHNLVWVSEQNYAIRILLDFHLIMKLADVRLELHVFISRYSRTRRWFWYSKLAFCSIDYLWSSVSFSRMHLFSALLTPLTTPTQLPTPHKEKELWAPPLSQEQILTRYMFFY